MVRRSPRRCPIRQVHCVASVCRERAETRAIGRSAAATAPAPGQARPTVDVVQLHSASCSRPNRRIRQVARSRRWRRGMATPTPACARPVVPASACRDRVISARCRTRWVRETGADVELLTRRYSRWPPHRQAEWWSCRANRAGSPRYIDAVPPGAAIVTSGPRFAKPTLVHLPHAGHAHDTAAIGGLIHQRAVIACEMTPARPCGDLVDCRLVCTRAGALAPRLRLRMRPASDWPAPQLWQAAAQRMQR